MVTADLTALGVLIATAAKVVPDVVGILAMVYYAFVVYDRIRYGPEIEKRLFWQNRKDNNETGNT